MARKIDFITVSNPHRHRMVGCNFRFERIGGIEWMLQFIIAAVLVYVSIIWYLRSLRIRHEFGTLYVVITGCDTGFGRELAYRLDRYGFNVFAACLSEEGALELDQTTSKRLRTTLVDVTKQDTILEFVKTVKKVIPNDNALWAVVNNAGIVGPFGICGLLRKEDYIKTLNVNLFGMMDVTKQFLPLLRKSKGRVLNVSSVAGKFGAILPPYVVSKFGVEAYSDCLRRELYHQGVSVHTIAPGMFATNIQINSKRDHVRANYQRVLDQATGEEREYYGSDYPDKVAKASQIMDFASKDTYKVINAYFHALTARFPKERYIVGIDANTLFRFLWICPEWISDFIWAHSGIGAIKPAALRK